MARSVLSEPSSSAMVTRQREPMELQRNVEDHEGRVAAVEAGTGGSGVVRVQSIPLRAWRTFDAELTALPTAPANDDFGVATAAGSLMLGASASATTKSHNAGFNVPLPADYVPGGSLTFRVRLKTAVAAQVSATIDLVAKALGDAGLGADICATAAQSTNATTTTLTDFDFVITPTGLVPGDVLNLVMTDAIDDTGGAHASLSTIVQTDLRYLAYP